MHPAELFSCAGHVVIVTGGASGIGLACAEALGNAGAKVLVAGLAASEPEHAAVGLRAQGIDAVGVACDVTDPAAPSGLVNRACTEWGHVDTVVAAAGAALDDPESADHLADLDRMYALHVRAVAALADAALPEIAAAGGGSFTVISSIAGLRGNTILAGYGVTKAANAQLARNLAVQWGPRGVRANAISPGVIRTGFATPITETPGIAERRMEQTPLRRFGEPHEVAGAVVWLASPAGAFVTGQNIVVDGGTLIAD